MTSREEIEQALRDIDSLTGHPEPIVDTSGEFGPRIMRGKEVIIEIPVIREVWLCDDEEDGCPEVAAEACRLAQQILKLPEYLKQLLAATREKR
jgi:hypothetical protein